MKYKWIILDFFLAATNVFGQVRDKRAELEVKNYVKEISVSPDEKIWLVTEIGRTYFSQGIDSNWHSLKPVEVSNGEEQWGNSFFGISFFNADTAILNGYISLSRGKVHSNGIYFTANAGSSWKFVEIPGGHSGQNVFVDKTGTAWIGSSTNKIRHSKDFGQHWELTDLPYDVSLGCTSIFMLNSLQGILGVSHNAIYMTWDNWRSSKKIATPLDQGKYSEKYFEQGDKIEKVFFWRNYIVAQQDGHVFYSNTNTINWKTFPVNILDVALDKQSNKLFAVTDSLKIILFNTPGDLILVNKKPICGAPMDMEVVNHSLYVLCMPHAPYRMRFPLCKPYDLYKINEAKFTRSTPYTTEEKISWSALEKQFEHLSWGVNRNQVYIKENGQNDWYRENTLDFFVSDFKLLSDSVAILWDGEKNNYLYSLKEHRAKAYVPTGILDSFLALPLQSFSVKAENHGCMTWYISEVKYDRTNDSSFNCTTALRDRETNNFQNRVKSSALSSALHAINKDPFRIPSIKDFQITKQDKKEYLKSIDNYMRYISSDFFTWDPKTARAFYHSVPAVLDTLNNNSVVAKVLSLPERSPDASSQRFAIELINQNNDTLHVERITYLGSIPWNLPWKFNYKGLSFTTYNVSFSRFVDSCIPPDFLDKGLFSNVLLMQRIADHLYIKK